MWTEAKQLVETVNESHFVEWMVIISTIALTVISAALTWVTYLVHRDSVNDHKQSVTALSHDNDNMYDIAKSEMEYHHEKNLRELKRVGQLKRRDISN